MTCGVGCASLGKEISLQAINYLAEVFESKNTLVLFGSLSVTDLQCIDTMSSNPVSLEQLKAGSYFKRALSLNEIKDAIAEDCKLPTVTIIQIETRGDVSTRSTLVLVDLKQPQFSSDQRKESASKLQATIKSMSKIMTSIVRTGSIGLLQYGNLTTYHLIAHCLASVPRK